MGVEKNKKMKYPEIFVKKYIETLGQGELLDFKGYDTKFHRLSFSLQSKKSTENTASSFAGWMYHLLPTNYKNENSLEKGKEAEKLIQDDFHNRHLIWRNDKLEHLNYNKYVWEIVYEDKHGCDVPILDSDLLTINGLSFKCKPDLVLRNRSNSVLLIIESKAVNSCEKNIPPYGWPNLVLQLWCYSWIQEYLSAPEVILVGSIHKWNDNPNNPRPLIRLDVSPRNIRSNYLLNRQCAYLFNLYGGVFNCDAIKSHKNLSDELKTLFEFCIHYL